MLDKSILFLGFGYVAQFAARYFIKNGYKIFGTSRNDNSIQHKLQQVKTGIFEGEIMDQLGGICASPIEIELVKFTSSETARIINQVQHIIISTPPATINSNANNKTDNKSDIEDNRISDNHIVYDEICDPSLALITKHLPKKLQSITYLSSTGIYGDHQGRWVDENTPTSPDNKRNYARLKAEKTWEELCLEHKIPLRILRLSGIYGPGRNPLMRIKNGTVKSIFKPGQVFCRIHVADITNILFKIISEMPNAQGIFNLVDDYPCSTIEVNKYAAQLLNMPEPEIIDINNAELSEMGKEFYSVCKRVSNQKIKKLLNTELIYPSYKEGLILGQ